MFRKALALTAAVLCMGAGSSDDLVGDLVSGRIDPLSYDYGVLRERPDAEVWLKDAEVRAQRMVLRNHGVSDDIAWADARYNDCKTEQEMAVLKGLSSARKVATAAEWRVARAQATDAETRRQSLQRVVFSGEAGPYDQLRGVERRIGWAKAATDPVLAELFQRNARDNFSRMTIGFSARQFLLPDVSEAALDLYDAKVSHETCLIDASNRAWLKDAVARRGWFRISVDGARADEAARNMVQHADGDVAFQQAMLALLEKELAAKETEPAGYAYLWDRVAANTGRPQRYASQGRCVGPGDWRPDPLEDPANVQQRRLTVGIDWPMKDYIAKMNTFCR